MFAAPPEIVLDDGVGRGKNGAGGAVILLQLDHFDVGIVFLQLQQIGRFRAAPAVNALIIVPHHAQIAVARGQLLDQLELGGVGVLIFIHHHVFESVTALLEDGGMLAEKLQGEQDQVVEIDRIAGAQGALITGADVLGEGGGIGIGKGRRRPLAAVAVAAQQREHGGGVGLLRLVGNMAEDFFDGAELIGLVVDHEIALVTEMLDVLAQNPGAERMKSANDGAGRFLAGGAVLFAAANQPGGALLHLAGGFVGEGDGQDVAGIDAFFNQARHARGDDASLARSGAGQNQHRALGRFDGLALRGI